MSKVDIISGFLGAGKTTFIKKLIKDVYQDEQIVLIENEFGEIGIDGTFMNDSGIEVTEINSGCICCSLVGDFEMSLKEVLKTYHPDRIIIEPSGVGKLSDVIKAVNNVSSDELILDNYITVIDAKKCRLYTKNFGEFFNNQIEYASLVILSRTQDISDFQLDECIKIIKKYNDHANIITTPWLQLTKQAIINAFSNISFQNDLLKQVNDEHECYHHEHHEHHECDCHHEHHKHHNHHADEVFTSWGIQTPKKYSKMQLEIILKKLSTQNEYGNILRAKGYVDSTEDEWLYFDLVPGEYQIRTGLADFTGRICVIGENLDENELLVLFNEVN